MKEKQNISLDQLNKKLPFVVPENYFEEFATSMEQKIGITKTAKRSNVKIWMYGVAASFIGLVAFLQFNNQKSTSSDNVVADNYESYVLSQVDETSLIDYYVSNE